MDMIIVFREIGRFRGHREGMPLAYRLSLNISYNIIPTPYSQVLEAVLSRPPASEIQHSVSPLPTAGNRSHV